MKPWIIYGSILGGLAALSILAVIYFKIIAPKLRKNKQKPQSSVNNVEVKLDLGDMTTKGKPPSIPSPKNKVIQNEIIQNVRSLYDDDSLPKETTTFLVSRDEDGKEMSVRV